MRLARTVAWSLLVLVGMLDVESVRLHGRDRVDSHRVANKTTVAGRVALRSL